MTKLDFHQALVLDLIRKKTGDVVYHLRTVEEQAQQVRLALDVNTHVPTPSSSSSISLHIAVLELKLAESQARKHLEDLHRAEVERLIVVARERGQKVMSVMFKEDEEL